MTVVTRLVSVADVGKPSGSQGISVSVRYSAECDNGMLILLLDDRGWSTSQSWSQVQRRQIEEMTRVVVGPDEPVGDQSVEDAVNSQWEFIREILARHGVKTEAVELRNLRHDVVVSKRLLDLIGGDNHASA